MTMRDPKLREQLETHHRNANLLVRKQREKDETAARMARILRDEDEDPSIPFKLDSIKHYADLFERTMLKTLITGSAGLVMRAPRDPGKGLLGKSADMLLIDDLHPSPDDRIDAIKFSFGFALRPTSDVLRINCT